MMIMHSHHKFHGHIEHKSRRNSSKMVEDKAPGTTDSSQTSGSKLKRLFLDLEILPTLVVTLSHPTYYSFGLTAITCTLPFCFHRTYSSSSNGTTSCIVWCMI